MEAYSEFRPTGFDRAGACATTMGHDEDDCDRSDWLIVPVTQTRDSGSLALSNFATAVKSLEAVDPDGTDHEVHRFGHWGPGWYEIIIVRPDSPACKDAGEMEAALADYPVLSDEDHSAREYEQTLEDWSNYGAEDFRQALEKRTGTLEVDLGEVDDDDLLELAYNIEAIQQADGLSLEFYHFDRWGSPFAIVALPGVLVEDRPASTVNGQPILSKRQRAALRALRT